MAQVREFKADRPLLLAHLPKALREKPAIRALTLRVIEQGNHYIVPGRTRNYLVTVFGGRLICDCIAGTTGATCAHHLAAKAFHERKYGPMAVIQARRVDSGESGTLRQHLRLQKNVYGGMFARYTLPKQYAKFSGEGTEERFFVTFLVTHDVAGRPLPHPTEVFGGIRPTIFLDEQKGMMSSYVAFLSALLAKTHTPRAIAEPGFQPPDLDKLIGYPARIFVRPAAKANKNGLWENQIDFNTGGLDAPDTDLRKAIAPLYKDAEIKVGESGLAYLAKPRAVYADEVPGFPGAPYMPLPGQENTTRTFTPGGGDGYFEAEDDGTDIPF